MKARRETIEQAGRWVRSAEDDFLTARNMLALGRRCPCAVVGFHSQQCAEKYMKAMLTLHSIEFPKTHDLIELLALVPRRIRIGLAVPEAAFLSRFAVETRYPGSREPVTPAEARRALRTVRGLRKILRRLLPKAATASPVTEEG
ncbi:MAG: HEPN domain-containing protein [Euryarchaeota archaeon]|nr:HEPN domain-containing protein [Euryarchaeota archaeon]